MTRVIVYLSENEFDALQRMAAREIRPVREQVRYLIVRGLAVELKADTNGAPDPAARPAVEGVADVAAR